MSHLYFVAINSVIHEAVHAVQLLLEGFLLDLALAKAVLLGELLHARHVFADVHATTAHERGLALLLPHVVGGREKWASASDVWLVGLAGAIRVLLSCRRLRCHHLDLANLLSAHLRLVLLVRLHEHDLRGARVPLRRLVGLLLIVAAVLLLAVARLTRQVRAR